MIPDAIDSDTVAASAHIARVKSVICGCELPAIKAILATNASFDPEKRDGSWKRSRSTKKSDHDPTI
jgi:hypothetical protein